jgi:hypothetical protein
MCIEVQSNRRFRAVTCVTIAMRHIAHFTLRSNDNMRLASFAHQCARRQPPNLGSGNELMHYVAKKVNYDKLPLAASDLAVQSSIARSIMSTLIRVSH